MSLLDSTNLPWKTASATSATAVSHSVKTSNTVITTTSDKENIKPSPNQQPTNLSNGNDLADFLQDICWEETWQLDGTATSVDAQEPVQQWCEDDVLLYWIEEFNKLRNDKSVEQAFQCIQESESIHPLFCGFVNNDDEWGSTLLIYSK